MSEQSKIDILERALKREKEARKVAEEILEQKSRDLYYTSQELKITNAKLFNLLEEKSSELQGFLDNLLDAYLVMNLKGYAIKMNSAAKELLEYDIDKEKLSIPELIYKEDEKYAFDSFLELTNKGFFNNYTARIITKTRKVKWVEINASIIYNKDKTPIAAQGIIRDITALKNLEEQKEKILKELENRNNELKEYAHIVSHDLKSPLRSINALTNWIKSDNIEKFDEATLQNFELVEITLEKMEHLISDILTYSSAGVQIKEKEKVDLNVLVENLKKILFIPENVSVQIVNKLPIVLGDKTKFQQLFQNLISNAVKFCDKEIGLVTISMTEKKSFFEFSIKDNGIGIEKKYHKKIFKIFNSLQESKTSNGIGLSIVKKIIELYDGEIWLESLPNKGTTFFFTIKK